MNYDRVILPGRHQNMLEGIWGVLEATFNKAVMVADDTSLFDAAERLDVDSQCRCQRISMRSFPRILEGWQVTY